MEIPAELRHYDERRWFLATQVAEVKKFNLQTVQDFVDLAAMVRRGEMVPLPAVTDTYILFGVGAKVDGDEFTRYVANQNLELNDEGGLCDAYARLESANAKLQKEISDLEAQSHFAALKNHTDTKQDQDMVHPLLPAHDVEIVAFIQWQTRTPLCPSTLELMPARVDRQK